MTRDIEATPIDIMAERLRLLPRGLRVAHLRALIGREFPDSIRRRELSALLHDEMAAQAGEGGGL